MNQNYHLELFGETPRSRHKQHLLKRIVWEVLTALKLGAIRKLSAENPQALNRLFMPLHMKYLDREIRKHVQVLKR